MDLKNSLIFIGIIIFLLSINSIDGFNSTDGAINSITKLNNETKNDSLFNNSNQSGSILISIPSNHTNDDDSVLIRAKSPTDSYKVVLTLVAIFAITIVIAVIILVLIHRCRFMKMRSISSNTDKEDASPNGIFLNPNTAAVTNNEIEKDSNDNGGVVNEALQVQIENENNVKKDKFNDNSSNTAETSKLLPNGSIHGANIENDGLSNKNVDDKA